MKYNLVTFLLMEVVVRVRSAAPELAVSRILQGNKAMRECAIRFGAIAILLLGLTAPAVWAQNTVQTIAGGGPNNLPALKSSLGYPSAVALDGAGNIYIANPYNGQVFKADTTGNVTVVAGNGARGGFSNSDGSPAVGARLILPTGVAVGSSGNVFIADRSNCKIREVSPQTRNISTVAGTGSCGFSGDGGPATSATLDNPSGVVVDKSGNILIADTWNCVVREVSAQTGNISTLAGTPPDTTGSHCGYSGDGGLATSAKLELPNGVAVDVSGNIFIPDTGNCRIREVSAQTGIISTVAGTGSCGYSGDGGLATSATLNAPDGVATDSSGNIFIADTSNCVIRKVSSSNFRISTVAGNYSIGCGYSGDGGPATSAQLNQPYGVAVDSSGDILIADYKNSVIREVSASTGNLSTFAGVAVPDPIHAGQMIGFPAYSGDGYVATDAEIGFLNDSPWAAGLATDSSGNVFIADTAHHAIREVSASTGVITTVVGNGLIGYSGDGGPAIGAQLFYPRDVAADGFGNIYIVDSGNCVIRKISASTGIISTVAGTLPDSSGNYYCGYAGDGGPATNAELYPIDILTPAGGVTVDSSGNIFIADTGNSVIREVSASTGIITTVAGIANNLYVGTGDGGPATSATLFAPYGVAVDHAGNIFIADTYDFAIREVMAANGTIYTVAGNMVLGRGFSGDGGPPDSAQIGDAFSLFLDPAGNLFIPDPDNCVIREVSASTGVISTVAGTPNRNGDYYCGYAGDGGPALSAIFDNPGAAEADTSGDLVVLDNIRVRTVAGMVQGSGAGAVAFPNPLGFPTVALRTSDTLSVMLSNRGSLQTSVSTVAISGTNAAAFSETDNCAGRSLTAGGDSCAISVKFTPSVAGVDSALLTITDTTGAQAVSLTGTGVAAPGFSVSAPTISFGNQQETAKSSAMSVMITNIGSAALSISLVTISGANAGDFAISTNSCSGATIEVNATCSVSATFTPSITGTETASVMFADNAADSPQSVGLTGTGTDFSIAAASGANCLSGGNCSTSATISAGSTATYDLQVTPSSGFNGSVALTCSGAPGASTCTVSPTSVPAAGSANYAFTVTVGNTSNVMLVPQTHFRYFPPARSCYALMFFPILLFVLWAARPHHHARRQLVPTVALLFFCILYGAGCGGGGGGGSSSTQPPTNAVLKVTGTSSGVNRTINLHLTVNH